MTTTVLCIGTATGVGKTWVGAAVLRALRDSGRSVAARKPVQSFDPADGDATDAYLLAQATGEAVTAVCPPHRWYELAMAPPIAQELLGRPSFGDADLAAEHGTPVADVVWVETVGGPLSPISKDGDSAGVARWLQPDLVVLVADARLGAINAVRLAVMPLTGWRIVVFLNRYDASDVCRTNRRWLSGHGFTVITEVTDLARCLDASA